MRNLRKRLLRLLMLVGAILLVPLIAMQFTDEVNWGWGDFIIAGILLLGTGLLIEHLIRRIHNKTYQRILISLLVVCLILLWAELGVGLFGSPFAGN